METQLEMFCSGRCGAYACEREPGHTGKHRKSLAWCSTLEWANKQEPELIDGGRRMVVYIAGPFRGETPWHVEQNIRRAEEAALSVAHAGHVPLCPHTMYRHFDKSLPDEFWLAATIDLLDRCDAILMIDGWQNSKGSLAEHERAQQRLGMRIFYGALK